jgi:hypothetical protein
MVAHVILIELIEPASRYLDEQTVKSRYDPYYFTRALADHFYLVGSAMPEWAVY